MLWFITSLLIRLKLWKVCLATSVPIKSDLDEFTNVFSSTNPVSPAGRLMILHRTLKSILFDIRMTDLHRCPVWQAYQHSMPYVHWMYPFLLLMLKLNVPSIARPVSNWCVPTDSLSKESVKELCSAACNGDLYVDLKAMIAHKFTASLQLLLTWWWRVVISITGIFGNILTPQGGILQSWNGNSWWPCFQSKTDHRRLCVFS